MSTEVSQRGNSSPFIASALSIVIPGAGSIYARQFTTGLSLMGITAVLLVISFVTGWVPYQVFILLWGTGIGHAAGAASGNLKRM